MATFRHGREIREADPASLAEWYMQWLDGGDLKPLPGAPISRKSLKSIQLDFPEDIQDYDDARYFLEELLDLMPAGIEKARLLARVQEFLGD